MSGSTAGAWVAECRKFAPNIFNKSKCSSCFKQKEEHSAEALECNRASRKISKCGYLFVAPGWDFSNPLNRTKRWQRRWFVLYDDGELTYSVDEHPETVPQARIDMTRVLEVAAAEDVTGHPYSLAITAPEGVTFVKGTCREETRWWADVLQVYSRNKGRHKRNATFPGGQTTILQATPTLRSNTPNPSRPRFNSCRSEPRTAGWMSSESSPLETTSSSSSSASASCATSSPSPAAFATATAAATATASALISSLRPSSVVTTTTTTTTTTATPTAIAIATAAATNLKLPNGSGECVSSLENGQLYVSSPASKGTINALTSSTCIGAVSSLQQQQQPTLLLATSRTSTATTSNGVNCNLGANLHASVEKPPIVPKENRSSYRDQPASGASPPTRDKLRAEDKARRRMNQYQLQQQQQQQQVDRPGLVTNTISSEKLGNDTCRRIFLEHEREREGKLRDIAASLTQPRARRSKPRTSEPTRDVVDAINVAQQDKLIRGDPDGCGLDVSGIRYSPTSELRFDLPAEDLLNIKKGWLMKQGLNKEWNKHWFVLRGCGLMYYRDPGAEDKGIMDGVIDLNTVTAVTPVQVARNYGFQTVTWDDRGTTVLSAVTAGIRASWMSAIRKAANLPDGTESVDIHGICQDGPQQQDVNSQSVVVSTTERDRDATSGGVPHSVTSTSTSSSSSNSNSTSTSTTTSTSTVPPSTPLTPRSVLFSSDEEYRTASEGGRRESGDWSEIPISPPLIRNGGVDWSSTKSNVSMGTGTGTTGAGIGSTWTTTTDVDRLTNHEWSELPPSPPLTRTALSRVKARSRSNSRSRVYKRSRSSPPNSRRSTLDSVKSEDLMLACCEIEEPSVAREGDVDADDDDEEEEEEEDEEEGEGDEEEVKQENLERLQDGPERNARVEELLNAVERSEELRSKELASFEGVKILLSRDKEHLECRLLSNEATLRETSERCEMLATELSTSHRTVEHLQKEVTSLSDRLSQGIEENERLYDRIRELEGKGTLSAAKERGRSFDSLSDLTNIDLDLDLANLNRERILEEYDELRSRFEKAVQEIRAMRKELREAHTAQDALELELIAHKQDAAKINETNQGQIRLMAARIQDLTSKLANSEKQVRLLKQKLTKIESRDKRRSLSLKGRESFQISQEVEEKLLELESKIRLLEGNGQTTTPPVASKREAKKKPTATTTTTTSPGTVDSKSRLRRKSLDSATNSEPMKILIRLSTLENRIQGFEADCNSSGSSTSSSPPDLAVRRRLQRYERLLERLRAILEEFFVRGPSKCRSDECLERIRETLREDEDQDESREWRQLLEQFQQLLRTKGAKLRQRWNEADGEERARILAEKLAFESVLARQLRPRRHFLADEILGVRRLALSLERKLAGEATPSPSVLEFLSSVLGEQLPKFRQQEQLQQEEQRQEELEMELELELELERKQRQLDEALERYKAEKLREIGDLLAFETVQEAGGGASSGSRSNLKLVEESRAREAWSLAQENVNRELIRAEIQRLMLQERQDTLLLEELQPFGDELRQKVRQSMERHVEQLQEVYEESLRRLKSSETDFRAPQVESKRLIQDLADLLQQKALLDARIDLLRSLGPRRNRMLARYREFLRGILTNDESLHAFLDDRELFSRVYLESLQKLEQEEQEQEQGEELELERLAQTVALRLQVSLGPPAGGTGGGGFCDKCVSLREKIRRVGEAIRRYKCRNCEELERKVEELNGRHRCELEELRRSQERDLLDIRGELDNQRSCLTSQYEQEAASLRERARRLEHRLNAIDSEHSAHVNELRVAYQRSISAELDTDSETRKRYKEEIKQLRGLCEKGLLAMENSHRRIVAEMEEKHRQELENLRLEKEQALSEETQATLAALDAMRKAHEHEVQKEIAKFKQEFIKQMQTREDIGALHKVHQEEMEEIKQEILSLSAKYSSKCVESAALEEKVGTLTKQLAQAQQHIMQLDARNKQLRAHLVLETNDAGINDTVQLLRGRDNEIAEQREEIHRLQQQLKHGEATVRQATDAEFSASKKSPVERRQQQQKEQDDQDQDQDRARKQVEVSKSPSFSYTLERVRSFSLPYSPSSHNHNNNNNNNNHHYRYRHLYHHHHLLHHHHQQQQQQQQSKAKSVDCEQGKKQQQQPEDDNNGVTSSSPSSHLWDSLRPRSGLPHQYQGSTTEVRDGGTDARPEKREIEKQQQRQQQQQRSKTPGILRTGSHGSPSFQPDASALSVAELMRSSTMRWSGRSCRSLPPTPTPPSYHPLHPPLPAVGMVAERKKRFEL